ncbi:MAG: hypothetical protein FJZ92_11305 [Chloroflexi bacterium]|nr:hypothetical protein [Chloroflexota bacterium]
MTAQAGDSLTIRTDGDATMTLNLGGAAIHGHAGGSASASLSPGARVLVHGECNDDGCRARLVVRLGPPSIQADASAQMSAGVAVPGLAALQANAGARLGASTGSGGGNGIGANAGANLETTLGAGPVNAGLGLGTAPNAPIRERDTRRPTPRPARRRSSRGTGGQPVPHPRRGILRATGPRARGGGRWRRRSTRCGSSCRTRARSSTATWTRRRRSS